ncbi:PKD domain-containing protein, partial [Microbacterium sp. STN6]|uniref:PKD domain-containing protein n=1 Tax=Microbacterium sp. STN6 TaxID=2995588 RepID=UPI002260DA00
MFMVGIASPAQALLPGPAPIEQRSSTTATADNLPTVQIDSGVVWNQVVIGDIVYAGGSFSNARPAGAQPGTNLIPRSNLLAYNITTGDITPFAPQINGTVKSLAVSPDGTRLYVGGSFNSVNGQTRWNLAAFDVATGQLVTSFNAAVGGSYVNAIAVTATTVYVGGLIGAGNGVKRQGFAAFNTSGGLLGWAPTSDLQVDSMVITPQKDKLIAAGRFSTINGVSQRGLAALDLTTGALLPWTAPTIIKNGYNTGSGAGKAGIWSLTTDQNAVYGTGWVYADTTVGNLEGTFSADPESGDIRWIADCHGDHFGVYSDGTTVYTTSHEHACESAGGMAQKNPENMRNASALTAAPKGTLSRSPWVSNIYTDWSGYPAPAVVDWYPDWYTGSFTGLGDAGYSIVGTDGFIAIGGEFPGVNGQAQQGLVRFSANPPGGPKQGPRLSGSSWTPTARSVGAGSARVTIPANWDRDDLFLTYKLMRVGTSQPVATTTVESTYWNLPTVTLKDTGVPAGSTQSYYVVASDPDGNSVTSPQVSVQIGSATASSYVIGVLDDGPTLFWPLGGPSSTAAVDWAGSNDGTVSSGVGTTSPGAIAGDTDPASTFNGSSSGLIATSQQAAVNSSFSTELWFKTTTRSGGKLVGYGSDKSGSSSSYDRHVYMLNNGRLTFGTYPGTTKTVTSSSSYNDGQWHYLVAEQGAEGMKLFIDGGLVGSDSQTTTAQSYSGYWRLGGDNLNGWPGVPTSNYFNGALDNFAVYDSALTPGQIAAHYALGTGQGVPTAAFTATSTALSVAFDASGSAASSGKTIASYSWNFGDDTTGTGVAATHTYSAPGNYPVTLTVTDSAGVPSTASKTVTVAAPHTPPTAVIEDTSSDLTATFDGTGSRASDGAAITDYAWNFGDGFTSNEAKPVHTYSAAGTYTVTLTVTDNKGAVSTAVTKPVTVTAPPVNAVPVAAFDATVSGLTVSTDGSGSADSDGSVASYSWQFGDGGVGTGKTATHTYSAAGTYTVTLTVTDNKGAVSTAVTKPVTVTAPAANVLAQDAFGRTVSNGWGSADVGGSWTLTGSSSKFQVNGGVGQMVLPGGSTRIANLDSVASTDTDSVVTMTLDSVPTGGGNYASLIGRQVGSSAYAVDVWVKPTGDVFLILRSGSAVLNVTQVSGLSYTANLPLKLRVQVTGTSPTTISAKAWPAAQSEPASWQAVATDSAAALQAPGGVGLKSYLSGSATASVTTGFDDFIVTTSDAVTPPPVNAVPVAAFDATVSGLTVSTDGSGSADSDGSVASYSWQFG